MKTSDRDRDPPRRYYTFAKNHVLVPNDDAVFGGGEDYQLMLSATATGPRLVAVGGRPEHDAAAVWVARTGE